ncbi:hypothetical protein AAHH84_00160 [Candidatus Hodgkinia cicadicola]
MFGSKPAKLVSTAPTVTALTQTVEPNGVVLVFELSINVPSLPQAGEPATCVPALQPFAALTHTVLWASAGALALNALSFALQPRLIAADAKFDSLQVVMPLRLVIFDFVYPVAQLATYHVLDATFPRSIWEAAPTAVAWFPNSSLKLCLLW